MEPGLIALIVIGAILLIVAIVLTVVIVRKAKFNKMLKKNGKIVELYIDGVSYDQNHFPEESLVNFHVRLGELLFTYELTDDFGNKSYKDIYCDKIEVKRTGKRDFEFTFNDYLKDICTGYRKTDITSSSISNVKKISLRFENGFVYTKSFK